MLYIAIIIVACLVYYAYKSTIELDSEIELQKIKLEMKKLDLEREMEISRKGIDLNKGIQKKGDIWFKNLTNIKVIC